VIQGAAPAFDMTIARDRTIGILFGNLVVAIVFTQIWPVTIAGRIDPAIAGLLRRRPGLGSEHAEALGTRGGSSGKSRCRRAGDVRFRAGCLSQWRWLDHRPDACRNPAPAGEECVHRCLQHGAVGCRHASTGSRRAWYCTAMIIAKQPSGEVRAEEPTNCASVSVRQNISQVAHCNS
jgi:hypothetical protein